MAGKSGCIFLPPPQVLCDLDPHFDEESAPAVQSFMVQV